VEHARQPARVEYARRDHETEDQNGLKAGIGHEVEFDDGVNQSVTILTTTKQKIVPIPRRSRSALPAAP
jgi:hypothetical protein